MQIQTKNSKNTPMTFNSGGKETFLRIGLKKPNELLNCCSSFEVEVWLSFRFNGVFSSWIQPPSGDIGMLLMPSLL